MFVYWPHAGPLTYIVAWAIPFYGHEVFVWMAAPEHDRTSTGMFSEYLASIPRGIISTDDTANIPPEFDHLVIRGHSQLLQHGRKLEMLASRSRCLTSLRQAIACRVGASA